MADRIIHKRSLTIGSVPASSSLELGELAINVADGKIYVRRSGSVNDDVVPLVSANTITTGSITATSFTGSLQGTASNATSSSYAANAEQLDGYDSTAFAKLSGGNTFFGDQIIDGNLQVIGTASFAYTTASIIQVGGNIITLNTDFPAVRFGGISVIDSGSFGNSSTGSLFWDSLNNRWVYSNPSGSTYDGGLLISGPRNTSGLGNEQGMDANFVAVGQGADHIRPGSIYNSGSITIVTGSLTVTQGITGSLDGTASNAVSSSYAQTASYAPDYVLNNVTSSMLQPYVLNSVTSSMLEPYILTSITSSMLQPYVLSSVTSSMLQPYVLSSATASMLSPYVLTSVTSSMLQPYVLTSVTASMLAPYIQASQTSSMTVLSSSFATTASYIDPTFISASAAASGFGGGGSIPAGALNIEFYINGNSAVIQTSVTGTKISPAAINLTKWAIAGYANNDGTGTGSIVLTLTKNGVDMIGAGNAPTITSAQSNTATISGWTSSSIAEGDIIVCGVSSVTSLIGCNLILY